MTSKESLYLLMTNQKKVRDDFRFIDLNTREKVSIEECYDIVIKDLEMLEILKKHYNLDSLALTLGYIISISINKDDKDFKKVKEWLENEKEN